MEKRDKEKEPTQYINYVEFSPRFYTVVVPSMVDGNYRAVDPGK